LQPATQYTSAAVAAMPAVAAVAAAAAVTALLPSAVTCPALSHPALSHLCRTFVEDLQQAAALLCQPSCPYCCPGMGGLAAAAAADHTQGTMCRAPTLPLLLLLQI
jgi:hypothetical protein